jgi:hypothetical protein
MQIQEQVIAEIAKEVVARLRVQMQLPDKTSHSGTRAVYCRARRSFRDRGRSCQRGL